MWINCGDAKHFPLVECLPSETFVRRLHGSALPDPSPDLSSPSDFSRNDFPRPKSNIIHENAINLSMRMTRNQDTHLRSPSSFLLISTTFKQHLAAQVSPSQARRTFREFLGASSAWTSLFPSGPVIIELSNGPSVFYCILNSSNASLGLYPKRYDGSGQRT
jgi:hypothetical protein